MPRSLKPEIRKYISPRIHFCLDISLFSNRNSLSYIAPAEILSPQEPTAISVNETDSVRFVCTARGYPAVGVTWWHQNTQLMDSEPRLSIQSVTVEGDNGFLDTTSTLTIPSVNRSDVGDYTCVASNTLFGSPVSDMQQFMLTVNCKYLAVRCKSFCTWKAVE